MSDELPLDSIDLSMLAADLDNASWDHETYLDRATGQVYSGAVGEVFGPDGLVDPEELEELDCVRVEGDGSRAAYRAMEDFIELLADRRLADRLAQAIEGKGAFRRFRDVLHRDGDETVGRAWSGYEEARSQLRALDWLQRERIVGADELEEARRGLAASVAAAVQDVAARTSGARLVLVNGMPGAGKSTLAARYRDEHPGVLVVEADVIRTWIGGDPADHAEAARTLSLALARAHLEAGYDVVVPQLVTRLDQVERFEEVAEAAGAELVEVVLHGGVVESRVPDAALEHLVEHAEGLAHVVARRPGTHRLATRHGDVDSAYRALADLLDPDVPA